MGISIWQGIMAQLVTFKEAIVVDVRLGSDILFWEDRWCHPRPLKKEALIIYDIAPNQKSLVADCWTVDAEGNGQNIQLRRLLNVWELTK